jgi:hypothetical protein
MGQPANDRSIFMHHSASINAEDAIDSRTGVDPVFDALAHQTRRLHHHVVVQALLIATCTVPGIVAGVTVLLANPELAVKPAIAFTS